MHARQHGPRICGIIVTYNPGSYILQNVNRLCEQVDEVVIVDNGSSTTAKELLHALDGQGTIKLIFNPENLGIAAALNIGLNYALSHGYEWAATFDQDSRVTAGMLQTMLGVAAELELDQVAILAPRYRDQSTGRITSYAKTDLVSREDGYSELVTTITSGNLVNLKAFRKIGPFKEDLFIDYVDNEYCLRCGVMGYKIYEIFSAVLEHNLGVPSQHQFLGKRPVTTNHSPLRRYYIFRNRVYVYKQYFGSHPSWVVRDISASLKEALKIVLFEENRRKKLKSIFRGIGHGMIGRFGKI
ncbi:MAG: glycosyltransferase family 2 protein [Pseudomonadota bacterium]